MAKKKNSKTTKKGASGEKGRDPAEPETNEGGDTPPKSEGPLQELTPQENYLCMLYVTTCKFNKMEAGRQAGYSESYVYQVFNRPHIDRRWKELANEITEEVRTKHLSALGVMGTNLIERMASGNLLDFVDPDKMKEYDTPFDVELMQENGLIVSELSVTVQKTAEFEMKSAKFGIPNPYKAAKELTVLGNAGIKPQSKANANVAPGDSVPVSISMPIPQLTRDEKTGKFSPKIIDGDWKPADADK